MLAALALLPPDRRRGRAARGRSRRSGALLRVGRLLLGGGLLRGRGWLLRSGGRLLLLLLRAGRLLRYCARLLYGGSHPCGHLLPILPYRLRLILRYRLRLGRGAKRAQCLCGSMAALPIVRTAGIMINPAHIIMGGIAIAMSVRATLPMRALQAATVPSGLHDPIIMPIAPILAIMGVAVGIAVGSCAAIMPASMSTLCVKIIIALLRPIAAMIVMHIVPPSVPIKQEKSISGVIIFIIPAAAKANIHKAIGIVAIIIAIKFIIGIALI